MEGTKTPSKVDPIVAQNGRPFRNPYKPAAEQGPILQILQCGAYMKSLRTTHVPQYRGGSRGKVGGFGGGPIDPMSLGPRASEASRARAANFSRAAQEEVPRHPVDHSVFPDFDDETYYSLSIQSTRISACG